MYEDLRRIFGGNNYCAAIRHWVTQGIGEERVGRYALHPTVFNAAYYQWKYHDLQHLGADALFRRIFPPLFSDICFQINWLSCFRHYGVGM
jgi:hypothetical protein